MKDAARIGERMSEHTDLDRVREDTIGDVYEGDVVFDFPRLLYVKLKRALPNQQVEVWHNHFDETVTIVIDDKEATIPALQVISRHLLVPLTEQLVKDILE